MTVSFYYIYLVTEASFRCFTPCIANKLVSIMFSATFLVTLTASYLFMVLEVETDAHGISSSSLRSILENWSSERPKPRILYTVPVSTLDFSQDFSLIYFRPQVRV